MTDEEIKKIAKQTANEIGEQLWKAAAVFVGLSLALQLAGVWLAH